MFVNITGRMTLIIGTLTSFSAKPDSSSRFQKESGPSRGG
jgi:hypothetical protein